MSDGMTRRDFLAGTGAVALGLGGDEAAAGAAEIPERALGRTGVRVPILGFGTACAGERRTLNDAVALYHRAMDLGLRYFDTAPKFSGYGEAQVQLGHALRDRRKSVFLVTKCWKPRAEDALRLLEKNLKELQTDHADLVHAHSVGDDHMPLEVVTGKGGVMEFLARAKREGLTRFVGISGHNRPARFLHILRDFDVDVMMNAVNFVDRHTYDFEGRVWPTAARKGVGLVAMKVFGGEYGTALSNSQLSVRYHDLSFRYALSRPGVACAVIGMATMEELERNVAWARSLTPLTAQEEARIDSLGKTLAERWGAHFGAVV